MKHRQDGVVSSVTAFEPHTGRVWAICEYCRRWNLLPIEERWEAVGACEALFEGTTRRYGDGSVTVARVNSVGSLVRIGGLDGSRYAAWRYGDELLVRSRRARLQYGSQRIGRVFAYSLVALVGPSAILFGLNSWYLIPPLAALAGAKLLRERLVPLIRIQRFGEDLVIWRGELHGLRWLHDEARPGDFMLQLRLRHDTITLQNDEAYRVMRPLLAIINWKGATAHQVDQALRKIEHAGGPAGFLDWTAEWSKRNADDNFLRHEQSLAFEIALHENTERRAMSGQLSELKHAWQEADAIARIADDLHLPEVVGKQLATLKRRLLPPRPSSG